MQTVDRLSPRMAAFLALLKGMDVSSEQLQKLTYEKRAEEEKGGKAATKKKKLKIRPAPRKFKKQKPAQTLLQIDTGSLSFNSENFGDIPIGLFSDQSAQSLGSLGDLGM